MDGFLQWLLAGSIVCLLAGWLGYGAVRRARAKRQSARALADAAAWAEAQRLATEKAARHRARQEAAALAAARLAAVEAARIEAGRLAAQEAARVQSARLAAEQAALDKARAEAAQRAADEATRAGLARAAAEQAARLEAERQAAARASELAAAQVSAIAAALAAKLSLAPAPAPLITPAPAKTPEQTLVMVADDSKLVRVKTGRLLAQHQYQIVYATDGLEAARQIEASMPDVVITDVDMPGMDGFELTRHVRQNPLTAHIPVIMITAADDKHRADADLAGVSVLLGKPYPEDELIAHIRRAMNPDAVGADALA